MGNNGTGAGDDMGIIALAIGRVGAVGDVDKALMWQLGPQCLENAQPAYAAVEDA